MYVICTLVLLILYKCYCVPVPVGETDPVQSSQSYYKHLTYQTTQSTPSHTTINIPYTQVLTLPGLLRKAPNIPELLIWTIPCWTTDIGSLPFAMSLIPGDRMNKSTIQEDLNTSYWTKHYKTKPESISRVIKGG